MVMSIRQTSLESSIIAKRLGTTIELRAQVVTDPHQVKSKVIGSRQMASSYSFMGRALLIDQKYSTRIPVRVITSDPRVIDLLPGQIISGRARLIESKEQRVAGMAIFNTGLTIESDPSMWAKALGSIRAGLRSIAGDGDAGALIPGMVLGDTSRQSQQFTSDMRRSGLTHLVAVSGANFAIVSGFVLWLMSFAFPRMRPRLIATSLALTAFIALVRPSPSVLRAAAMASVLLYAKGTRQHRSSIPALGFAIGVVVIGDPWQSRDPGFALSVLATAGLLMLAPMIKGPLSEPLAAMVFCSPILIAISGFISPMSLIANVAAAPVVAPITIVGFVASLIHPLAPWLAQAMIYLIRPLAAWIALVAKWCATFSVLSIGVGTFIVIVLLVLLTKKKAILLLLVTVLAISYFTRFPGGEWKVANCDIGQGDSMVLSLGDHRAIVIDVGPDAQLEDRCLSQLGIKEVPLLILSHFHADHVEGLPGLLRHRMVGEVWVSNNFEPAPESARVKEWLGDIPMRTISAGARAQVGQYALRALWPDQSTHSFATIAGDGSSANNSSIALQIDSPDFSLFTAGDLEPAAQSELVHLLKGVDLYKVCHHGSRYQDESFTRALSPRVAVISVGRDNSYGHPAPETMGLLARLGAKVVRTDRDGAVAINAHRHRITIRTSNSKFSIWRWS